MRVCRIRDKIFPIGWYALAEKRKISFVIPVYNSEKTIRKVVEGIVGTVNATYPNDDYEIVLVNDGSHDSSWETLESIHKDIANTSIINLSKNFGQANATLAGLNSAIGDFVIGLDDDMQTPPEEFPKLLECLLESDYDAVYARYRDKKHSTIQNFGSRINNSMSTTLAGKPKGIRSSSFYCIKKYVVDEIIKYDYPYPYLPGLVFRVTDNVGNCFVEHRFRENGKSNYTIGRLLRLWLNGFTGFSILPLRISVVFGMIFSIAAFVVAIILIINKLLNPGIALGWTSTVVLILMVGGIQLLCIGLLGEYVGRSYININKSPQYIIKDKK